MHWRIPNALFLMFLLLGGAAQAQSPAVFLVGAAEADITPEISKYQDLNGNGRFDFGDPKKPFGFGDKVLEFTDGRMVVGNGQGQALYIYDRLFAYALVVEDPTTHVRVAMVNSDIYLLTGPDIDAIRALVDPKANIDFIAIAATHNHMGPDTLGTTSLGQTPVPDIINALLEAGHDLDGVNRAWFEKYRATIVDCIERAAASMQPAHIQFAKTEFRMGLNDMREPHIIDSTLNVMKVDTVEGKPIATLIQWANHPESVLLYGSPGRNDPQLPYDTLTAEQKEAWGRVFTAGFPGYARETLRSLRGGGIPMYINGPLGGMMTTLRAVAWDPEAHPQYPADTPLGKIPTEIRIPNDFRFAPVLGRELGKAAMGALETQGETAVHSTVSFAKRSVLIPMENNGFRAMASLGVLGYEPGKLYDDQGREDLRFGSWIGGLFLPGVKAYTGKNVKSEVSVINIGRAQFVNIPAEPLPELIVGLPEDFITNEDAYFPKDKQFHAHGNDFRLAAPPLKSVASGDYLFVVGLSGGELGYVVPACDFDPPKDLRIPPFCWSWWICFDAENDPHYEDSMAISSQLEPLLMIPLAQLLKENPCPLAIPAAAPQLPSEPAQAQ